MKTCENCYWVDKCQDAGKRCEYYDPIFYGNSVIHKEYEKALKERVNNYNELVHEQQDNYCGE